MGDSTMGRIIDMWGIIEWKWHERMNEMWPKNAIAVEEGIHSQWEHQEVLWSEDFIAFKLNTKAGINFW